MLVNEDDTRREPVTCDCRGKSICDPARGGSCKDVQYRVVDGELTLALSAVSPLHITVENVS
jgi:hypothetical protein